MQVDLIVAQGGKLETSLLQQDFYNAISCVIGCLQYNTCTIGLLIAERLVVPTEAHGMGYSLHHDPPLP